MLGNAGPNLQLSTVYVIPTMGGTKWLVKVAAGLRRVVEAAE